ncbi:MAG: hypothetical protein VYD19_02385 [Myxococcota bacterium]|nr:hypothetical protein [Myxococcota bacterium]
MSWRSHPIRRSAFRSTSPPGLFFCTLSLCLASSIYPLKQVAAEESVTTAQSGEIEKAATSPSTGSLGTQLSETLPRALQWQQESAWQPPKGELGLGLWSISYAPLSWLSVETLSLPWLLNLRAMGASHGFGLRSSLWSGESWSAGFSLGYLSVDIDALINEEGGGPSAALAIVPVSLYGSWHFAKRWLLSAAVRTNQLIATGSGGGDVGGLEGVAGSSNSHLRLQLAWAFGEKWSLWFIHNRLLSQSLEGQGYSRLSLEGGGEAEIYLSLDSNATNFRDARSNGFRLLRRGSLVSFSFGFDSGQAPLYLIGTVTKEPIVLPHFDLIFHL